jgi:NAD+ kinase
MRIAVIANKAPKSIKVAAELKEKLAEASFELTLDQPNVVITVGGDGTLLNAFHSYVNELDKIRFIGVHTGHLGFYTDWRDYELDYLVESLKKDNSQSVSYPLLNITLIYEDDTKNKTFLALNEVTVKNLNGSRSSY